MFNIQDDNKIHVLVNKKIESNQKLPFGFTVSQELINMNNNNSQKFNLLKNKKKVMKKFNGDIYILNNTTILSSKIFIELKKVLNNKNLEKNLNVDFFKKTLRKDIKEELSKNLKEELISFCIFGSRIIYLTSLIKNEKKDKNKIIKIRYLNYDKNNNSGVINADNYDNFDNMINNADSITRNNYFYGLNNFVKESVSILFPNNKVDLQILNSQYFALINKSCCIIKIYDQNLKLIKEFNDGQLITTLQSNYMYQDSYNKNEYNNKNEDNQDKDEATLKDNEDTLKNEDNQDNDDATLKDNEDTLKNEDILKDNVDTIKDNEDTLKDNEDILKDNEDTIKDNEDILKNKDTLKNEDILKDGEDTIIIEDNQDKNKYYKNDYPIKADEFLFISELNKLKIYQLKDNYSDSKCSITLIDTIHFNENITSILPHYSIKNMTVKDNDKSLNNFDDFGFMEKTNLNENKNLKNILFIGLNNGNVLKFDFKKKTFISFEFSDKPIYLMKSTSSERDIAKLGDIYKCKNRDLVLHGGNYLFTSDGYSICMWDIKLEVLVGYINYYEDIIESMEVS